MSDLFDGYRPGPAWDEVFATAGEPREGARALHDALAQLSAQDLASRSDALERAFRDVQAARFHPLQAKPQRDFTGRVALGWEIDV